MSTAEIMTFLWVLVYSKYFAMAYLFRNTYLMIFIIITFMMSIIKEIVIINNIHEKERKCPAFKIFI